METWNHYKEIWTFKSNSGLIDLLPKVKDALTNNLPVVALESTIITHGMPYPSNLETALDVENIVREQGAVPATIGVIGGRVKVGLRRDELERLAKPDRPVVKISRRDFPFLLSKMKSVRVGIGLSRYNTALGLAKRSLVSDSNCNFGVIDVLPEVKDALTNNLPVVALESTIITHGMPYPSNLETALDVENIVREQGAVPATIGVIGGRVKVGLRRDELERLAKPDRPVVKISRRDFPFLLSKKMDGGTTVAGTVLVAEKIGIKVFVTGGIGGVHRGVESTMDISADLMELSRSSVTVVSSGIKSILDIGRTLEYLETLGVCVVTMGDNNSFPAFYTRESGHKSPYHVKNVDEASELIASLHALKMDSGVLLAVPVPLEAENIDSASMEKIISQSLSDCEKQGIKGKAVTPFVLERVSKLTDGKSLETNMALIKNNALIGSRVAIKLETLMSRYSNKKKCPQ